MAGGASTRGAGDRTGGTLRAFDRPQSALTRMIGAGQSPGSDFGARETDAMSTSGGTKAIVAALLANLGIAVTKFAAYLLSGSSSMLAESVHSLADSGNQVLLLIGGKRAGRAATEEHPFGYGRERYVYAFLVSIILFSVCLLYTSPSPR